MFNKTLNWGLVIFWCVAIYVISGIPHLKTSLGIFDLILRKIAHITEYAVLYFLFWRAYKGNFNSRKAVSMVVTAVFCVLYAMSDEFHQGFVPGRVCSWKDVLFFDTLGVGLMAFIMDRWYKR